MTHEAKQMIAALTRLRDEAREFRGEADAKGHESYDRWAGRAYAYNNALETVRMIANGDCTVAVGGEVIG